MASNRLPDSLDDIFILAEDMADGCHNHQAAVGFKQNLEADVRADLRPPLPRRRITKMP